MSGDMSATMDSSSRPTIQDRLLDAAGVSVERLPMLRVVFDRLATHCSDDFRQMSAAASRVTVNEIGAARIGNILDFCQNNIVGAVFYVEEWDSRILLGLDRRFVATAIELLFGSDGSEPPSEEERPFTNIEQRIARLVLEQAGVALQASFAAIAVTTMKFERIETRMDFVAIGRRNNFSVLAKLNLEALERSGEMIVAIPQTALDPIREDLSRDLSDEAARDPRWTKQIETEVIRAEVTLRAVIEESSFTLEDISNLRVGQLLKLQATAESRIKVECNDQPLFWSQIGEANGVYTICVGDFIDRGGSLLDDILLH